jgi:hypothetical protein
MYGGDGNDSDWVGNGLNENVWSTYSGKGCASRKWLAAFGTDASWKIQTKSQCVAKADAQPLCMQPLVLSMDDDACYCSTTSFCTLEITWSAMKTYELVNSDRGSSALTSMGNLYETFGTIAPTPSPTTASPTPNPTPNPTAQPTPSPTPQVTTRPTFSTTCTNLSKEQCIGNSNCKYDSRKKQCTKSTSTGGGGGGGSTCTGLGKVSCTNDSTCTWNNGSKTCKPVGTIVI